MIKGLIFVFEMMSFTIDMSHVAFSCFVDVQEWLAIAVSLFAGLATALGGCIVYFKSFVKLANRSFLSVALGFSAGNHLYLLITLGVMLLLSFYEMFSESQSLFMEYFSSERKGQTYQIVFIVVPFLQVFHYWEELCYRF